MTVGEIKIASLKLMFDVGEEQVFASDIETLMQDSNYSSRLILMNESIDRAIDKILLSNAIDDKVVTVALQSGLVCLKEQINDFYELVSLLKENNGVLEKVNDYEMVGADYVILKESGTYVVQYKHRPLSVTSDEQEVDVQEDLARIIPYFVKADLFEEDNPSMAFASRNIFENSLSSYVYFKKKQSNDNNLRIEMLEL